MTKRRLMIAVRVLLFAVSIALSLCSSWRLYHDRRYYDTAVLFYAVSLFCLWLAFCKGVPQVRSVRQTLTALGRKLRAHRPAQSIDELSRLIRQFSPQILAPSAIIEGEEGTYRIVVYLISSSAVSTRVRGGGRVEKAVSLKNLASVV